MTAFDATLQNLAKLKASGAALPANVMAAGRSMPTQVFLSLFKHDRRDAWGSLLAIGEHSGEQRLVCEIAAALAV